MEYFDSVVSEIHGGRVKEVVEHRANGGKVFATFCVYVPEEIVIAANGIWVGLCGGAELPIPTAEEVLPRDLCPLIKSSIGFKLERICPYFQVADLVVGETTCDCKKKAYEVFREYVPMYIMEVPQQKGKKDWELWLNELYTFKDKVEEVTNNKVTPEKLAQSIKLVDGRRAALDRLFALRKADPAPISGLDTLLVVQLAYFDDPSRATAQVNALCDELETRVKQEQGVAPKGAPRILTSGTPMVIPNWKVPSIVETRGAVIVCEESCTGTRLLTGATEVNGDGLDAQLKAIAERQLKTHCACFTPNDERIEDIIRLSQEYNVNGVIYCTLKFCQAFNVEGEKVKRALDREGIPLLRLETDYGEGDTGQITTRIEAFLEQIAK
jgi:benzoyl-CoA reductase/2-hydroxyglutaryl-CoA dehydratase subunit BcrC/BadD/HgdB